MLRKLSTVRVIRATRKEFFKLIKKVQFDYNSCNGKCFEKIRDLENIMQEISFLSVEQDHKTLAANFIRPQIKTPFQRI